MTQTDERKEERGPAGVRDAAPCKNIMKPVYRKIISFLAAICCLAGSSGVACAAGSGDVPRVVFENRAKDEQGLYVGKSVVDEDGDPIQTPDEFTFVLELGGDAVNQRSYQLCNLDWEELTEEELESLGLGSHNSFNTSSKGEFTLRAGLAAKFTGIKAGTAYTVTERPRKDYQQTEPAGGEPASGVMTVPGPEILFTNLYHPSGQSGPARIEVRKTVAFPAGYELPETPQFPFRLTLNGAAGAGVPYTVRDSKGNQVSGEKMTGENGSFTLQGGQTAVFARTGRVIDGAEENISIGMEYQVEELPTPGWTIIGDAVQGGGIRSSLVSLNFHNSEAAFVVTKTMSDGSKPEKTFTFQLAGADSELWNGAEYYLYNTRGNLIPADAEANPPVLIRQTEAGTFTLKPGEAAVFINMEEGTVYNVSEVGDPEYIQTVPAQTEGYAGQKVQHSPVAVLPFVNQEAPKVTALAVTKVIENLKGDSPAQDAEDVFRFRLQQKVIVDGQESWQPKAGENYKIAVGDSESTLSTAGVKNAEEPGEDDGIFTLKANQTARFEWLVPGEYRVEELTPPVGYLIPEGGETKTGIVRRNELTSLTFTNQYWADKTDLQIVKQNPSEVPLEGAAVQISKVETDGDRETKILIGRGITGADGVISLDTPLESGVYELEETKAPTGYQLPPGPVRITISRDLSTGKATVTESGDTNGLAVLELSDVPKVRDKLTVTLKNDYLYALPKAGGTGTVPYTIAGAVLMIAAAVLYLRRRRGCSDQ